MLQHCLRSASSNMVAVNFLSEQWYALLNISYTNNPIVCLNQALLKKDILKQISIEDFRPRGRI